MSRNQHSKNRRNTNGIQRKSGTRRIQKTGTTSTGSIPSSMSGSAPSADSSSTGSRSSAMSLASSALENIKSHPMPYALAGLGVACAGAGLTWLLVSAKKHAFDENGNALDFSHRMQASMKDVRSSMGGATASMRRATKSANAKVSQLAQGAVSSSKRIEQSVEDVVREHPIAVGAALLAAGAAIAMAIPRSTLEDTWLGRERDQVVNSAQKLAQGAMQKAQSLAKQMSSSASNGTANAHA